MQFLKDYLKNHNSIKKLLDHTQVGAHLSLTQESLLYLGVYEKTETPIFVVKENDVQVNELKETLLNLNKDLDVVTFIYDPSLRIEAISASELLKYDRVLALDKIINKDFDICIVDASSALRKISTPETLINNQLSLSLNQELSMDTLQKKLHKMGYNRVKYVEKPFTYAMRGGICDIFGVKMDYPVRIEFFDIEIESMRTFDIETQRSMDHIDKIHIPIASDIILDTDDLNQLNTSILEALKDKDEVLVENISMQIDLLTHAQYETSMYPLLAYLKNYATILDYVQDNHLFYSPIEALDRTLDELEHEVVDFMKERIENKLLLPNMNLYADKQRLLSKEAYHFYEFQHPQELHLPWHRSNVVSEQLEDILYVLKKEAIDHRVLVILDEVHFEKMIEIFLKNQIHYQIFNGQNKNGIYLQLGSLSTGFILDDLKTIIYTQKELFKFEKQRYRYDNMFSKAESLFELAQLDTFDYVVHRQYGIGKYMGITTKEVEGIMKDFMRIQYRDGDELFVPLEKFNLVRKYISSEAVSVKLSKLGSSAWKKSQERIKENVKEVADKLIALYTERSKTKGFAFSKDTEYQIQFEKDFAYELTPDQKTAVEEIKRDMESNSPMDRLLCGDVGFGKTEVAIRAAFKALVDEKQTIFLCPTTILSSQHYQTFKKRFKNFPVTIEVLNRFVTPSKQKDILKRFKEGSVDILIGTHRVLSKDVKPHDLGLLIIDEEQRFGVEHKEKIKEIKVTVDVLSLSATPIPRTLQMSLVGIRSLSQLNTPPSNRLPVMTYVIEKDEKTIYDIIRKELNRKGQVFYLFNNVERIYQVATHIQTQIEGANVGVIHGKMDRIEIEDVMVKFIDKEINTLVCTTIIETGIDIPNANTILVDNAHHFGLSQLYQIKGRVGRSDRLAYAYFLVPAQKELTEVAQKRLQAIKEFTQLGSGYKIAMRDLTIRGAGELLGGNQSGFIDSVGIELYVELLREAISMRSHTPIQKEKEQRTINVSGYLPDKFTSDDKEKLDIYQEINNIKNRHELNLFYLSFEDRYGKLPNEVNMLLEKKRLEIFLNDDRIDAYREFQDKIEVKFAQDYSDNIDGMHLFEIVSNRSYDIEIKYLNKQIILTLLQNEDWVEDLIYILENMKEKNT